ncbi:hypothetical protein Glove_200g17 [Diversispora epigaea]|uniref:Uncharacterized protein n=1 Tax=Diversispora epigaea TaxID=1348612 RepID=A0A397IR43_9GLOM|nr:hypothetical protein Glove_200g17 [Diversispora epigaea]
MPLPIYEIEEAHAIMLPNINRHLFGYTSYSIELLNIFVGSAPNNDEEIFELCEMYSDNIELTKSKYFNKKTNQIFYEEYLDIVSNKLIFRRIHDYKNNINSFTLVLLEAWYTNKDIINVITR